MTMKKLTISALVASTLLITACGDSQDAAGTSAIVGTAEEVAQLTQKYHDEMGAMTDSVVEVMETTPGVQKIVSPEGHVVGTSDDIAAKTAHYHKMMEEMMAEHASATGVHGIVSPQGHVVGTAEDIAAKASQYHKMMESLAN